MRYNTIVTDAPPSAQAPDGEYARLAYNENPEGAVAAVRSRVDVAAQEMNRYPFEAEARVMAAVAGHFGCSESDLMLVRGIDECFDRTCAEFPSMRCVTAWPGFDGYRGRIAVSGLQHFEIGLDEQLMLREEDLAQVTRNDFVVLADPSNPTGLTVCREQLARLQERAGMLLIDETYVDYSPRRERRPDYGERGLIFRSFSKSYGLAGVRLGAVFGPAALIASMKRKQWFCNLGILDLCALEATLDNDHVRQAHVRTTLIERYKVERGLREVGFHVTPSKANFVLVAVHDAETAVHFLRERGVHVKNAGQFGLSGHLRITIGNAWENGRLLAAMTAYSRLEKVIS